MGIRIHEDGGVSKYAPIFHNLRSQDLFTRTLDKESFYLASARIELHGVEALDLMRDTTDVMFVGDDIAVCRITQYLTLLGEVVHEVGEILTDVRKECDPDVYYRSVRPWCHGQDDDIRGGVGV